MKLYDEEETMHLETDALGIGAEARLPQAMCGLWFLRDKVSDSIQLQAIVFARKSLPSTEIKIQQYIKVKVLI